MSTSKKIIHAHKHLRLQSKTCSHAHYVNFSRTVTFEIGKVKKKCHSYTVHAFNHLFKGADLRQP